MRADHSTEIMEERTIEFVRYIAGALEGNKKDCICVEVAGATIVVARNTLGQKLQAWAKRQGLVVNKGPE